MYSESILRFSNVLDGTFSGLYYVDHTTGLTVGSGFHSKPLAGGSSAIHGASSYMWTRLTVWLMAPGISHVCIFYLAVRRSY